MRLQSVVAVALAIGLAACGDEPTVDQPAEVAESVGKLVIYTVNYPLAYFAERIGGDLVEVRFPAPPEEDPAFWSPDADTIAAYQTADLILLNGAGYAKWVERAALPSSRVVNSSETIADKLLPIEGAVTHSHGPEGEHEHGGYAFTTWLDPELAIRQAQRIAAAIALERPQREPEIQQRFDALEHDLVDLDSRLGAASATIGGEPLLFSHPVYQYLITRYGLNAVEVHWEPHQAPDGPAWDELERILENHPAKWMLWEAAPLEVAIRGLEDRGISTLVFNPCANRTTEGDYLAVMSANAAALETVARSIR